MLKLQHELVKFQTHVARANENYEEDNGFESEEAETIQNVIELVDEYIQMFD